MILKSSLVKRTFSDGRSRLKPFNLMANNGWGDGERYFEKGQLHRYSSPNLSNAEIDRNYNELSVFSSSDELFFNQFKYHGTSLNIEDILVEANITYSGVCDLGYKQLLKRASAPFNSKSSLSTDDLNKLRNKLRNEKVLNKISSLDKSEKVVFLRKLLEERPKRNSVITETMKIRIVKPKLMEIKLLGNKVPRKAEKSEPMELDDIDTASRVVLQEAKRLNEPISCRLVSLYENDLIIIIGSLKKTLLSRNFLPSHLTAAANLSAEDVILIKQKLLGQRFLVQSTPADQILLAGLDNYLLLPDIIKRKISVDIFNQWFRKFRLQIHNRKLVSELPRALPRDKLTSMEKQTLEDALNILSQKLALESFSKK